MKENSMSRYETENRSHVNGSGDVQVELSTTSQPGGGNGFMGALGWFCTCTCIWPEEMKAQCLAYSLILHLLQDLLAFLN
jgi:hypothetical protein